MQWLELDSLRPKQSNQASRTTLMNNESPMDEWNGTNGGRPRTSTNGKKVCSNSISLSGHLVEAGQNVLQLINFN